MACSCLCWKVYLGSGNITPGVTYNLKYIDCTTGLLVTIPYDPYASNPTLTPNNSVVICTLPTGFAGGIINSPLIFNADTDAIVNTNSDPNDFAFNIVNCSNPDDTLLISSNLWPYNNTGTVLQFAEFPGCWTNVLYTTVCEIIQPGTVVETFSTCETCAQAPPPEPIDIELDLTSCCNGSRFYFQIPTALAPSYGVEDDTYVYTGPPTADVNGNIMYPNQCYWIAKKTQPPPITRPVAPLAASFGPIVGTYPTGCSTEVCGHCFYRLQDCNNPANVIISYSNLSTYLGQVVYIQDQLGCWQVTETNLSEPTPIPVIVLGSYGLISDASCEACANGPVTLNFISCCGSRVFFQIPKSLISSYGNTNDTYIYTGPPIVDALGVVMYPNQCYYITSKGNVPTNVRPLGPPPSSLTSISSTFPTSCTLDVCSNCFYKLQNCNQDPLNILFSYSNLAIYVGQIITIQDYPGCWIVSKNNLPTSLPIAITPIQTYTSCEICATNDYFTLNDCCTDAPYTVDGEIIVLNYTGEVVDGITPASLANLVINTINYESVSEPITGCFNLTQIDIKNFPGLVNILRWEIIVQEVVTTPTCEDCQSCQPCYLLTDCEGNVDPIVVNNDLANFVGQFMELCPSNLPTLILPNPALGNPVTFSAKTQSTIVEGTLYDLIDCCNILPTITVNFNLSAYTNQILNIPTLSPTTCWLVKKSTLNIQPYVVLNFTGALSFTSCEICTNNQQVCNQNIPQLPDCICFQVSVADSCDGSITLDSIGLSYDDCDTCIGICYILRDCENLLPDIQTLDDLSTYVGDIIKIKTCPDTCWLVIESEDCPNPVTLPLITDTFSSCEDCLPPIPPPLPVDLITRRVKPGYYTKGCSPEYTEKISCKFGDAMFDEVAKVRYGIDICCDYDIDKWWIKKELLNLKAIYDPALDCPPKVCKCYTITQTAGSTDFKYINCEGDCITISLGTGETGYICSQIWPNALCPDLGDLYTIETIGALCTDDLFCAPPPPIPCYCYSITPSKSTIGITISYVACDGTPIQEYYPIGSGIINVCAQEDTLIIVEGVIKSISKNGVCEETAECLPQPPVCNCYQMVINVDAALVSYINCEGESVSVTIIFGESVLCALEQPIIGPRVGTATFVGTCESCLR